LITNFKYSGDKYNANRLKFFGLRQLEILKSAMRYQGLHQNRRLVKFADGVTVLCTSIMGIDTVDIYVPPLLPVLGKKVPIVEEKYCWCTTYFTEGELIEVINSDAFEGSYSDEQDYENSYFYYNKMFNSDTEYEDKFSGIMYKVKICRGTNEEVVICSSTDFTKYTEGMKVILFCVGDYNKKVIQRKYPFPDPLTAPKSCPGKSGKCYACSAILKPKDDNEENTILEGTYVLVPLTFEEDTGDANLLQVTPSDLENGEVYKSFVNDLKDINFEDNTIKTDWGIAKIHINPQAPFGFKDGCRVVALTKSSDLKDNTSLLIVNCAGDYYCLGHIFNTPAKCPSECLKFEFSCFNGNVNNYSHEFIFNLDEEEEANLIEDKKTIEIFGNGSFETYLAYVVNASKVCAEIENPTDHDCTTSGEIIDSNDVIYPYRSHSKLTRTSDSSSSSQSSKYTSTQERNVYPRYFCFVQEGISHTPVSFTTLTGNASGSGARSFDYDEDSGLLISMTDTGSTNRTSTIPFLDRDQETIFDSTISGNSSFNASYSDGSYEGLSTSYESYTNVLAKNLHIIIRAFGKSYYFGDLYHCYNYTINGSTASSGINPYYITYSPSIITKSDITFNTFVILYKGNNPNSLMDCEKITDGDIVEKIKTEFASFYAKGIKAGDDINYGDFRLSGSLGFIITND